MGTTLRDKNSREKPRTRKQYFAAVSVINWVQLVFFGGGSMESTVFLVVMACYLPFQKGFDLHFQASAHFPLTRAVDKSQQHQKWIFRYAKSQTWVHRVRSKNATFMPCSPHRSLNLLNRIDEFDLIFMKNARGLFWLKIYCHWQPQKRPVWISPPFSLSEEENNGSIPYLEKDQRKKIEIVCMMLVFGHVSGMTKQPVT